MRNPNFEIFLLATLALDAAERAEVQREFAERYMRAAAASPEHAEALAHAETHHLLVKHDFTFEGADYVRGLLLH